MKSNDSTFRDIAMSVKAGRTLTGEDLRIRASKRSINTSGTQIASAIQHLVRTGVLEDTGDMQKALSPQARGRKVKVYRRVSQR